jgi:hypothetical protein
LGSKRFYGRQDDTNSGFMEGYNQNYLKGGKRKVKMNYELAKQALIGWTGLYAASQLLGYNSTPLILATGAAAIGAFVIDDLFPESINRKLEKILRYRGLAVTGEDGNKIYSKLIRKDKKDYGYELEYKLPLGASEEELFKLHRAIEVGLNSEVDFWEKDGHIIFKIATHKLPEYVDYGEVEV